jgi:hypothetical protein
MKERNLANVERYVKEAVPRRETNLSAILGTESVDVVEVKKEERI